MDGGRLLFSCDWHFVIISFLQLLFRSVRFIYLDPFLSGLNLLILWSTKGNKNRKKKLTTKGGKMEKPTHQYIVHLNITSFVWPWSVLFWMYYFTFHVSSTLLKYSKSLSESSPFFQGKWPVWMGATFLHHNVCDYHTTR